MTVKEIFDLRKQGRIEEAYDAIRARYATYRGKYTTLCMFWTARDIFNLRMADGRTEEARKIYEALKRVLPNIDDHDGRAAAFMQYAGERLACHPERPKCHPEHPKCHPEQCRGISPCASLSRDDKKNVIPSVVEGSLNRGQQAVLDCIKANPGYRVPKIEEATNIPSKSIERHVSVLIAKGLIEHRGSKKAGGYYLR